MEQSKLNNETPKYKFRHTREDVLEFARLNPNLVARRIMKSGADDVAIWKQVEDIKDYCWRMMDYEALDCFIAELKYLGWQKKE